MTEENRTLTFYRNDDDNGVVDVGKGVLTPLMTFPRYVRTALRQRGKITVTYFPSEDTYGDIQE